MPHSDTRLRRARLLLPLLLSSIVTACGSASPASSTPPARPTTLDQAVHSTLDEIDAHGWNADLRGLYINWSVDDLNRVNLTDGTRSRHDVLTDLRDLVNMSWYERRHPGDHSQAQAISRLAPVVHREFAHYATDKGWVYWEFLRLADLGDGSFWTAVAKGYAGHLASLIDPATGLAIHDQLKASTDQDAATCSQGYRVDHTLLSALALVDAGKRFGVSEWSSAGGREASQVISAAYDTHYHLFARIVCQGAVWDHHAKMGEQSQEIDALLSAGSATQNSTYLSLAREMLDGLQANATGLHDTVHHGFHFMFDMSSGELSSSYKETRQLQLLSSLHHANTLFSGRYAALESEMASVALDMLVSSPLIGYPYREPSSYGFYQDERWISTEAMGIACEAMQSVL